MPYPEAGAQSFNGIKSVVPTLSLDDERAIDEKSVIFFLTRRYRRTTWGITMAATKNSAMMPTQSQIARFKGTVPMPARKPEPPPEADDPEQSRRFIDMAREIEADETPGAMDRAFEKVIRNPGSKMSPERGKS